MACFGYSAIPATPKTEAQGLWPEIPRGLVMTRRFPDLERPPSSFPSAHLAGTHAVAGAQIAEEVGFPWFVSGAPWRTSATEACGSSIGLGPNGDARAQPQGGPEDSERGPPAGRGSAIAKGGGAVARRGRPGPLHGVTAGRHAAFVVATALRAVGRAPVVQPAPTRRGVAKSVRGPRCRAHPGGSGRESNPLRATAIPRC